MSPRFKSAIRIWGLATIIGLVASSQTYIGIRDENAGFGWWDALGLQMPFWYGWALLAPAIGWTTRHLTPDGYRWGTRAAIHFGLGVGFSIFHSTTVMAFQHLVGFHEGTPVTVSMFAGYGLFQLTTNLLAYGALVAIVYAKDFYRRYRERELLASQLSSQLSEAQLHTLRMQLNPHFLFNAMNTIAMQVRQSANDDAVRMLAGLSDLLRHMLEDGLPPETQLAEELSFIRRYLEIEQVRFQDRLRVEIDAAPGTNEALVPTFVLQPLVENAIRHGISRRAGAGRLSIRVRRTDDDLILQVEDDGPGIGGVTPLPGTGLGLRNTRARLEQHYGSRQSLEIISSPGGGTLVSIRLPYKILTPSEALTR